MRETLHATYSTVDAASKAVGALLDHGVSAQDVSVLVKDSPSSWHTTDGAGTEVHQTDVLKTAETGITVTTGEDAMAGAAKGAGVGLGLGVLAALAAIALPGVGLVVGGGALAIAMAGAASTTAAGAVAGAVTGYLVDQGVNEDDVSRITETVASGGALVSVTVPSQDVSADEVSSILLKYESVEGRVYRRPEGATVYTTVPVQRAV